MKTPEEIKKGLEVCATLDGDCDSCPYDGKQLVCVDMSRKDALAYITQLEQRIAQAESERDAAVKDIGISCDYCAYADNPFGEAPCMSLEEYELGKLCGGWQWRGVCEENSK